jgi:hypothetical protein
MLITPIVAGKEVLFRDITLQLASIVPTWKYLRRFELQG